MSSLVMESSGLKRGINTPVSLVCSLATITICIHCHPKSIHQQPNYPTVQCKHHSQWRTAAIIATTTLSSRAASWAAMLSTSRASERYLFTASETSSCSSHHANNMALTGGSWKHQRLQVLGRLGRTRQGGRSFRNEEGWRTERSQPGLWPSGRVGWQIDRL